MNPRSILFVGNFLSGSTGSRSVCEDLAERFGAEGWRVLTTSSHPGRLRRLLDMLSTVWKQRREYSVAAIDTFSGPAFLWAEMTARLLQRMGKPYVLTLHGGNLPEFSLRHPGRVRRLLGPAAAVTTPSRYLQEKMKPCREDLVLIPNPLELGKYAHHPRSDPRPALVWLRAFHRIYNPALAIRTIASLRPDFPRVHLWMGGGDKGDGSLEEAEKLAGSLRLADHITFAGWIPKNQVPAWLQQGDIFINTTWVDNAPVSVVEAMACGLCVVSTNVGGIPYLLDDGKNAMLVSPDDPAAMAAAVTRVLSEPGLGANLSGNARKFSMKHAWNEIYPLWEKELLDILNAKP